MGGVDDGKEADKKNLRKGIEGGESIRRKERGDSKRAGLKSLGNLLSKFHHSLPSPQSRTQGLHRTAALEGGREEDREREREKQASNRPKLPSPASAAALLPPPPDMQIPAWILKESSLPLPLSTHKHRNSEEGGRENRRRGGEGVKSSYAPCARNGKAEEGWRGISDREGIELIPPPPKRGRKGRSNSTLPTFHIKSERASSWIPLLPSLSQSIQRKNRLKKSPLAERRRKRGRE